MTKYIYAGAASFFCHFHSIPSCFKFQVPGSKYGSLLDGLCSIVPSSFRTLVPSCFKFKVSSLKSCSLLDARCSIVLSSNVNPCNAALNQRLPHPHISTSPHLHIPYRLHHALLALPEMASSSGQMVVYISPQEGIPPRLRSST